MCRLIGRSSSSAASSCWRRSWTSCAAAGGDNMSDVLLEMRNISKSFPGVQALRDVHFSVHKGEILCLLGENGAGKSTLMKILTGVYPADAGTILFEGRPVR